MNSIRLEDSRREKKKKTSFQIQKWSSLVCLKIISSPALSRLSNIIEGALTNKQQTKNIINSMQNTSWAGRVVSRQQIDLILIEEISKKSVANYTQWEQSRYKVAFEQFKRFRK